MSRFRFSHAPVDATPLRDELLHPSCGGFASFEGWVRDHNEGQAVTRLEYEAFEQLGLREGEKIIAEACERFGVTHALCVHRLGDLGLQGSGRLGGRGRAASRRGLSCLPLHHR